MDNTSTSACNAEENKEKYIVKAVFGAEKTCAVLLILSILVVVGAVFALAYVRFVYFALMCFFAFVIASLGLFVGRGAEKEVIEVSEKFVHGKTIFGSDMYLPSDEITAVGKTAFGGVIVTTSNFRLRGYFVKNRQEILDEIIKIINK